MQNQQMAQMQAQMNANGSVNGTPVMGNMAQPKRMGNNDPVEKLNTYIYDYFLRNRHHALARAMLDGDLKMSTEKPSPNKSNVASDIDMPDDMPQSWSQSVQDMTSWRPSVPSLPKMPNMPSMSQAGSAVGLGGLGASQRLLMS